MVVALRYRRVSGDSQEENSSLATQLERMDEYCRAHHYETTPLDLFTEVMTGVETWRDRPKLQALFTRAEALAQEKEVVVVVDHPDRLARGLDLVLIIEMLHHLGVRVEFVQTKFEDTDEGKLVLHLESYSSKKEWLRIQKRTKDGIRDRVMKEHKGMGNEPSYGYKWDDPSPGAKNRYVYNDDPILTGSGVVWTERKVVEFIFQKAKEGLTCRKIADLLNSYGIPLRKDGSWNKHQIIQILTSEVYQRPRPSPTEEALIERIKHLAEEGMEPASIAKILNSEGIASLISTRWSGPYIGKLLKKTVYMGKFYIFRNNYTRHGKNYRTTLKPLEDQVLMPENFVPAIVDEETYLIVQRQLAYNQENASRNNKHADLILLRGSLSPICGHCGRRMHSRSLNQGKYHVYVCRPPKEARGSCVGYVSASTQVVEDVVLRYAYDIIRNPYKLKESIAALHTPDPTTQHGKTLEQRKKEVEEDIAGYVDLRNSAKSEVARKNLKQNLALAEEELEKIESDLKILEGIREYWEAAQQEIKRFENWCALHVANLEQATPSEKCTMLEYLGIRVTIWKYGSPKRYKVTVAPPSLMEKFAKLSQNRSIVSSQSPTRLRR